SHYASADDPALKDRDWIGQQWETARLLVRRAGKGSGALLVLDEIQKIPGWSEVVKRLWDEDTMADTPLRVVVLGSSPLLVQQGLSESLAGRFEVLPVHHWFYAEMRDAFGWSVEQYVFFGGYPGAAQLVSDPERWRHYVLDSLVETSVSRDVLLMTRVDKPALLRRLFELGCVHSGQVLSYQKMVGQLQDAGNTTTLAHYLQLLRGAGLVMGIEKYMGQELRRRATSPKLLVMNTALMTARSGMSLDEARFDPEFWGRLVETAVGAHLANAAVGANSGLFYWSGRNCEVDFVLSRAKKLVAIEVKSGRVRTGLPGIEAFSREHAVHRKLLVGQGGIPPEQFFDTPVADWFE
ncbi:MAG: DUF4143 domain-containing protein, partial [Candidatus Hydrogenedentales bacterium]